MKVNPTVVLTFVLLGLMFGAGMVSGSWGFALGREALKGITQPDVRPTSNIGNRKGGQQLRGEEIVILKESDVLKNVKAQMEGKTEDAKKDAQKSANKDEANKGN